MLQRSWMNLFCGLFIPFQIKHFIHLSDGEFFILFCSKSIELYKPFHMGDQGKYKFFKSVSQRKWNEMNIEHCVLFSINYHTKNKNWVVFADNCSLFQEEQRKQKKITLAYQLGGKECVGALENFQIHFIFRSNKENSLSFTQFSRRNVEINKQMCMKKIIIITKKKYKHNFY
jgi:hypothetical protein